MGLKSARWAASGAVMTLGVVAARQLGMLHGLPDPGGELWDSDGIVMSKTAHPAGIPDGVLGMASYGVTLGLLLAAEEAEWVLPVARAKVMMDAAAAAANTVRQVVVFRRMCSWCMATVVCTALMAAAALVRPDAEAG